VTTLLSFDGPSNASIETALAVLQA